MEKGIIAKEIKTQSLLTFLLFSIKISWKYIISKSKEENKEVLQSK